MLQVPPHRTLIEPILQDGARAPGRLAVVFIGEDGSRTAITAGQLRTETLATAHALASVGLAAGDVCVLVMGHSEALLSTFFGALALGAVPCIFSYPTERTDVAIYGERVRAVLEDADARAVVIAPRLVAEMRRLLPAGRWRLVGADELHTDGAPATPLPQASPDDVAFLQYTSGTTGLPKGIAHPHRRILDYVAARARNDRFETDDVIVSWLPLYHDLGLVSGLLTPLLIGLPTVLMSPLHWARDPGILLRAIHEFRGTFCWMPNFALNHCARAVRERDLEGIDLGHWRALVLGGEPVRLASIDAFLARFVPRGFRPNALMAGYGMAENVEAATATPREGPPTVDHVRLRELHEEGRAVPAGRDEPGVTALVSSGFPLAGTELRIVAADGQTLAERHVGEITIRSRYMLSEYHRRPDLTGRGIRDGWLHSGDLGYLAGGQLYVCGRKKDLIIVGGRNVHPEDLEWLADGVSGIHPGRVVAFGVEDDRLGSERVVMVCETSVPADDPQRLAIGRELRRRAAQGFDVALGDLRLVERGWLIKTSNGKIARAANREKYRRELRPDEPRDGRD